jgi:ubiquinone biosynthesis protein UbiJ
MPLKEAGILLFESAFNRALALDPEVAARFNALHGQVIGFELLGTGITLFFIPSQNGSLQVTGHSEHAADCLVSGTVFSLLRSHFENNPDRVFSGDVKITGNSSLAQKFTRILRDLDFDWEEQLSKITGDVIAHQVGNQLREAGNWLKQTASTSGLNLQEYLQEEIRLLPTEYELDDFFSNVDRLRDDAERLQARIDRLRASRSGSHS